ncbi:monovalent cation:H+ antiporter-2, CPA2 family [Rhizoctonia solani AG-1 IB]|uniref:Monovalent cation:H+ antiporter-2, CPA2 family n=1 Tax=Thanatephorus cucumeris (strain AG1-IB / isolate 7/3/14) TaxID=1108050 RepID=A0A0B7FRR4_THACB|nr:monovalent cation:H+ antiporter-2, CPA2 family [Rhizoctonia solani AG-1 IB]
MYSFTGEYAKLTPLWPMLAAWVLAIVNDVYMLTIDMNRGHTYIGCLGTQVVVSAIISLDMVVAETIYSINTRSTSLDQIVNGLGLLCSIIHLVMMLSTTALFRSRYQMTWMYLWKLNTKDAFLDATKLGKIDDRRLSIVGFPRKEGISHRKMMSMSGRRISKFFRELLFRRINSVETKRYALARNSFAVLAMGILVFRVITAFIQTQNKFSTRVSFRTCGPRWSDSRKVQILMQFGPTYSQGSDQEIKAEVWAESAKDGSIEVCRATNVTDNLGYSPFSLLLYTCDSAKNSGWLSGPVTYHLTIGSANGSVLALNKMPFISLMNEGGEIDNVPSGNVGPYYATPWQLNPGYHTEAEAGFLSRGFISSSAWRDLILDSDPEYAYVSVYPIGISATRPLQNSTIATARLRATFKPALRYLQSRDAFDAAHWQSDSFRHVLPFSPDVYGDGCDFVEDYRSGTILDILGSVGGLFAILQAVHVLLFGKPLFWGLMGTKLINPFGFIGSFGSENFRRRLHEKYGREPTKDNPDTIQTAAFLRDYVVDFGHLQTPLGQSREEVITKATEGRADTVDSQTPLMLMTHRGGTLNIKGKFQDEFCSSPATMRTRRNSMV